MELKLSENIRSLRRQRKLTQEQATVLLPQNDNPRVNEVVICGSMSIAWFLLGERDRALELMKQNNAGGVFNDQIGSCLAIFLGRPKEASLYLSEALTEGMSTLVTTILGYVFVFRSRSDWDSALAITKWGIDLLTGLKAADTPNSLDKTYAEMLALLGCVQAKAGMHSASLESLREAGRIALRFDSTPDYSLKAMRFADAADQTVVFDVFGRTAVESIAGLIGYMDDPELDRQWKEIVGG